MRKTAGLILVFSATVSFCTAQQLLFKTYTVQNGLVANPVRTVFQDAKGFIWIATWEGLSKYDGYRFTNFNTTNGLSHNLVNDFYEEDDKLFIAENDGTIDVIKNDTIRKIVHIPSPANRFLPIRRGVTLITTDIAGVYELSHNKIYKPAQEVAKYPIDRLLRLNDSLYLAHGGEAQLRLLSSSYQTISTLDLGYTSLGQIYRDSKGRVWLCSSQGLKLLSLPSKMSGSVKFSPLPAPFNIPEIEHRVVTDILENEDASFWIGTYSGLVHLESSGSYQVYTEMNGLPSKQITTLYRDKEDNIWIGTALGLAKYAGKTNVHMLKSDVVNILKLQNGDWILSTADGLQRQQKNSGPTIRLAPSHNVYFSIVEKSNPIKFYSSDVVGMLNKEATAVSLLKKIPGLNPADVASCTDAHGNSFIASWNGMAVVTNQKWYIDKTVPYRITSLAIDADGYLWAGTWSEGLFRIKYGPSGDSLSFVAEDLTALIGTKQIRSLFCDSRGAIWVGTRYKGVFCLSPQASSSYAVKNFEKPQGLASNFILSFAETSSGDIWIGSQMGLDKIIREKDGYRVFNFSKATNFFAQISRVISVENANWFCIANNNLFRFRDIDLEHAAPNATYLLSTTVGDVKTTVLADHPGKIVVSHTKNNAKFIFGSLSFVNEWHIQYSYRLQGSSDTAWSEPQNIHEVSYASLSPGKYTFEVRSLGFNGRMGEPAAVSFVIEPPFWRTLWFYIFGIAALAAIFYGLYRYRINQLLRLQKVRARIATDLHDDIGSTLTNISILSELSDKTLEQPAKARQYLHRITEEVNASGQALDDIIWSVNTKNDTLDEMRARMRRFASELFDHTNTRYHFKLEEGTGDKRLDMEYRRDIYLVYKEALNNIYKHASAKNVFIRLGLAHQFLEMEINDDGKGFDPDLFTHRNGLKNVRERIGKWKGTIKIESGKDQGTSIQVKIPVKHGLPK